MGSTEVLSPEERTAFATAKRLIAQGCTDDLALYIATENLVCIIERLLRPPTPSLLSADQETKP